ncbi:unnamed protein product [Discosporangium mesarthrocarpum]
MTHGNFKETENSTGLPHPKLCAVCSAKMGGPSSTNDGRYGPKLGPAYSTSAALTLLLWCVPVVGLRFSVAPSSPAKTGSPKTRADLLREAAVQGLALSTPVVVGPASAAVTEDVDTSLAGRIRSRSFDKQLFNMPPSTTTYPSWMEGTWDVTAKFNGYIFPNTKISKSAVVDNQSTPGFQQMSILSLSDIGPPEAHFKMRFVSEGNNGKGKVLEDRAFNLQEAEVGWLGKGAPVISSVDFESPKNPNRWTVFFGEGNRNGVVRSEFFANSRESQVVDEDTFVQSESLRQLNVFRRSRNAISREVISDYQHFWVFKRAPRGRAGGVDAYLVTAGYLQPQDSVYFKSPTSPVVLYSHFYSLTKVDAM